MKSYFSFLVMLLVCLTSWSQMTFSTLKYDFGDLESYDNRFVDITITNKSQKSGYVLSVRKPAEVIYIQNKAFIAKDSSLTLRFQVNPHQKGKFNYSVSIFTSDQGEPHVLQLKGNLLELSSNSGNSLTACPDFSNHPVGRNPNQFDLTVITIDKRTREELSNSTVEMLQDGWIAWSKQTDKRGRIKQPGTIGLAYFHASKKGYQPAEKGAFISNDRNQVVIELEKDATIQPPVEEIVVEIPIAPVDTTSVVTTIPNESKQDTVPPIVSNPTEELVTQLKQLEELEESNFETHYFKPANIVFVLDVSSSMAQSNRLNLMKYALNQLTGMIRQQDKITLVTYASQAKVLLPPTSGMDKETVYAVVKKVRASGMTAGGEGIRLGYEQALEGYLTDGINHVFVLTDGAFNQRQYDYKKLIGKYSAKNVQLSVVGIQTDEQSASNMKMIAELGKGEYVPISTMEDAEKNLRQTVRQLTFKSH